MLTASSRQNMDSKTNDEIQSPKSKVGGLLRLTKANVNGGTRTDK
jgi:hypothetical protein